MSRSAQPSPVPFTPPPEPRPRPVPVPPPVEPKRPRRWLVPSLLVGAGLLAGALYMLLKPSQGPQYGGTELIRTAKVVTGPIERVIRISGQTAAGTFGNVNVPVFRGPDSGRDLTLMRVAKAGSIVKKGQEVAALDAQNVKDHIDDTKDTVQQAHNDVEKKKVEQEVEWETLQQQLREAKADRDKAALDMKAAEVKTEIEREIYKLNAEEADANYKQLLGDLARKKAADAAEMRIIQITAIRQDRHLDRHISDLKMFTMHAPMDGLVVMQQTFRMGEFRQLQEGDEVRPGMPFMKIVDPKSMQIEGWLSQADSSELRVGQPCVVGLDAFPELRLQGKIYSMGALAVKGRWDTYLVRNVPVRISILGGDTRVIPDLSGWADVRLDQQENATLIPRSAVQFASGQTYVWVKNGGGYEKRAVELGIRSMTHVAVNSGLKPGEEVALDPVKAQKPL